ncbi:MAG: pyruvate kinase [Candidatus Poribacteria bacterium]|nr:pyruvate kinase [Candidatus Poribacteria bacterium]
MLSVDFHEVSLCIESISRNYCNALITNEGLVSSNKAVDLNREIDLRSITEKDEKAIEISRKMDVGHFALSFVSDEKAVEIFRKKIGNDSYLISKIECLSGLKNLQAIIGRTDALLIDRGDLSRQIPVGKIPFFQRRIISLSKSKAKPVFVATNLLETMVATKQPSRAEVNDVISTLNMGTSGLVLAAETAIGKYPVECVEMISRLIRQYEYWTPNTSIQELLLNE